MALDPPWNLSSMLDKPTTQLWTSQFPFLEQFHPHVVTVAPNNIADTIAKLQLLHDTYQAWWTRADAKPVPNDMQILGHVFLAATRGMRGGFVPFEYTRPGMLLRVGHLMTLDFCKPGTFHRSRGGS
jgi:hypothetical protein